MPAEPVQPDAVRAEPVRPLPVWPARLMAPSSFLFPAAPALLERTGPGAIRITNLVGAPDNWTLNAEGSFATEVLSFLESGDSATLSALGDEHPLTRTLSQLRAQTRVTLNAATALELDGFDLLFIEVVGRCNERCVHCYSESSPSVTTALDRATCESLLEDAVTLGFERVQFTGGDPLLCDFLPELVARAAELGIAYREIYTNGLLLSDALLDELVDHRPNLAFSFYSHDAETHDAITRTPGSQRRTLRAIERAVRRGLQVRVSLIVMEQNAGHVLETTSLLRSIGVQRIGIATTREVGRGHAFDETLPAIPDLVADVHRGVREATAKPRTGKLAVTSDGGVYPCVFNRSDLLGRVSERRLRDIARAPDLSTKRALPLSADAAPDRNQLQCGSCQLTARALRACRTP